MLNDGIPGRVALLVRDLVAYRNQVHVANCIEVDSGKLKKCGFLNVYSHNKGIDMIDLPSILHNRRGFGNRASFLR